MAQQCANSGNPVGAFDTAWDLILALDYKPIFETGRAALLSCPPDPALSAAVSETAKAALAVVQNIAGLRHDLLGRIFHTVLDTARYDGSFYTTTAAATLLAALAIGEDLCDWNDPEAIARLRITDPACGTGTLLMAAAERIREIAPQAEVDNDLARSLIEQVFSGYDVNLTATHMAATTLGLLSPTTRFRNMKIGRTLLGLDKNGKARLGSLEFLGDGQPMLIPFPNAEPQARQVDSGAEIVRIDPADLVIMNPPFTRDSLRHDQFDADTERKIKSREKELFADRPTYMAGNSGAFLILADYINRASAGAIAAVLPLVGATDKSGLNIRRHLGNRYHVETIVTSHDPERRYFSENTEIGEMLLICRRWPSGKKEDKPPTQVVNLARNPATPAEAKPVAWAIQNGTADSQGYGTVQEWPAAKMAAGRLGRSAVSATAFMPVVRRFDQRRIIPLFAVGQDCQHRSRRGNAYATLSLNQKCLTLTAEWRCGSTIPKKRSLWLPTQTPTSLPRLTKRILQPTIGDNAAGCCCCLCEYGLTP